MFWKSKVSMNTPAIVPLGDVAEKSGWAVVVINAPRRAKEVGNRDSPNLYKVSKGEFLIVPIMVRNSTGQRQRNWDYTSYEVVGENGLEIEADPDATDVHMRTSQMFPSPFLETDSDWAGEIVFDVPAGMKALKLRIDSFDENVLFELE